jgi:hypothetical protein
MLCVSRGFDVVRWAVGVFMRTKASSEHGFGYLHHLWKLGSLVQCVGKHFWQMSVIWGLGNSALGLRDAGQGCLTARWFAWLLHSCLLAFAADSLLL